MADDDCGSSHPYVERAPVTLTDADPLLLESQQVTVVAHDNADRGLECYRGLAVWTAQVPDVMLSQPLYAECHPSTLRYHAK